jgi:hypothetical protein
MVNTVGLYARAIERQLNELRADVAAVIAQGAAFPDGSAAGPAQPREGDVASRRLP